MSRLIKYINGLIAAVCLGLIGCVYWFGVRPLPRTSGREALPVSAAASITRDQNGVPHITAASEEDAWVLQGYVTAQDRMFQMDSLRRLAAGELASVLGARLVETDTESRRWRLRRLATQHLRRLSVEDRRPLLAYARGVNAYLERHRGRLPVEFALARYDPAPWSPADSIMIALQLSRSLSNTWKDEVQKRSMLDTGEPDLVEELFPVRTGGEIQLGSNAWVLSGKRTESGKPLLANDPHLAFSVPSIWHPVRLKSPAADVAGITPAGLPGVLIGHNRRIAWGMTMLHFDVTDLVEVTSGPVMQEPEVIAIRGGGRADLSVLVTRHGPVFHTEAGKPYALRWTTARPDGFAYPIAELNRATNWDEFRKALSRYPGPNANVLYADVDGHIGWQTAGFLPVRKTWNGDLPVRDGAEWDGFIPFDEMPRVFDPPSGVLISSNQNPFPAGYKHRVHGNFAAPYRNRQIAALLAKRDKWSAAALREVQKDVYSPPLHFLAGELARAAKSRGSSETGLDEAAAMLAAWNGQMDPAAPAPFLATLAGLHVRKAILERAAPDKAQGFDSQMSAAIVEKVLRERSTKWFADVDAVLAKAFADSVDEARRMRGRNMKSWTWGSYNQLNLEHPAVGQIPFAGKLFRLGPEGLAGGVNCVSTTTVRVGPSARYIADLADWDRSYLGITQGVSGHPLSWTYRDQWKPWLWGTNVPMPYDKPDVRATLEVRPLD